MIRKRFDQEIAFGLIHSKFDNTTHKYFSTQHKSQDVKKHKHMKMGKLVEKALEILFCCTWESKGGLQHFSERRGRLKMKNQFFYYF
jgi:hypothetical protein